MTNYLLDTNVVSNLMRITPNQFIIEKWSALEDQCAIAAITWHELLFGMHRMPESKRKQQYAAFLTEFGNGILILPYTLTESQWHAEERARLMAIGKPSAYADGQIAAIAVRNNLTLVTANTQDFAAFNRLRLENWFSR